MTRGAKFFAFGLCSLIAASTTESMNDINEHIMKGDVVVYLDSKYSTCFWGIENRPADIAASLSKAFAEALPESLLNLAQAKYAIDNPDAGLVMLLNLTIEYLL